MALRTLQSVVATNYSKESADPILAGDIVAYSTDSTLGTTVNPPCIVRAIRYSSASALLLRGQIIGVCADDGLGTNPAGEAPTMINNDAAGSNFVNGNVFQSYTAGFYVGVKRAIADYKDESIDVVTNLTAGIPPYSVRGVTVYTTPSTQFITDRVAMLTATTTVDSVGWTGTTGSSAPTAGDLLTVGASNGSLGVSYASTPTSPSAATASTNNRGLLVSASTASVPVIGRVDFYDSGSGLLYWTLI